MQFDEAKIFVKSGSGGDGMVSFRREKYEPMGGPFGGDGGRGGDVILRVNPKLNTLLRFRRQVHFRAESGKRGETARRTGASADSLLIEVPPGTVVRDADTDQVLADLVHPDDVYIAAKGGRGGRGNINFVSPSNQAPRVAEKGAPGEEHWLRLELKLIADVGIVGMPNAGKSTLLSVISNAKPKIAPYPFTTLEPNLGVVDFDDQSVVAADIPGLIEGAHMGVGLGHSFLRHVQRTRLLIHLLDGTSEDPVADLSQINTELALYDENLKDRAQIIVFTKMDIPDAAARWDAVRTHLQAVGIQDPIAISAATKQNIHLLLGRIFTTLADLPDRWTPVVVDASARYELPEEVIVFEVQQEGEGVFRVSGPRVERAAAMTYWDNEEALLRFQTILEAMGVTKALKSAGVSEGDTVYIGEFELEWSD